MKNIILAGLAIVLFTACNQNQRYTQNSPEIDTFKSIIKSYNDQDWEGMTAHYADTAKTFNNSSDLGLSVADMVDFHKESMANLANRGFLDKDQEYEMVVTDKGATWVNFWGDWEATLKANGEKIKIPIHLTGQFKDGKIVRTSGNWDNAPMTLALQEIEKNNTMSVDEKAMQQTINTITKAWNTNDKDLMASVMVNNFIRTENGNVVAKNSSEYATNLMDVYHGGFPDFKVTINKVETMGNMAYLNWTCTGTNTGSFQDGPATNKPIVTHGFSQWTFNKEGKAEREDGFYDNLVVFAQLGYAMPALK